MLPQIEKFANPLIKYRLFDTIENAMQTVTLHYTYEQVQKYRRIVRKFERKYQMSYTEFLNFCKDKAHNLLIDPSLHEEIVQLEDDAFEWKIGTDGFNSWQQVHQEIISCL